MTTEAHLCWECGVTVGMTREWEYKRTSDSPFGDEFSFYYYMFSCPLCGMPSIAMRNDDEDEVTWVSTGLRGRDFPDVPSSIAGPASEAHVCFSAQAYRAAILMARAVVEATCKNRGITKGTLEKKIDELHAQGFINEQVHAEATEIRLLGNDMAHGDFDQEVTATDAEEMLGLMAEVLEEVFQRPARLAKRREKRQSVTK